MLIYTHPLTGMKYKKEGDLYYFITKWPNTHGRKWIMSGMNRGFVLI